MSDERCLEFLGTRVERGTVEVFDGLDVLLSP
jgi:hypothetical protein